MTDTGEEEWTVASDATIPETHLVGMAANGVDQWLVMKQDAAGLLDADYVRELIAKAEPAAEAPRAGETVTMSGSPAAIAEVMRKMHASAVATAEAHAAVAKAELSSADLNDLPDSAFAYIESGGKKDDEGKTTPRRLRHFAIHDKAHADNAATRIAQGAKFGDKAKAKVQAAQRKFGEDVSKETTVPEGALTKDVSAGMPVDDGIDGMDPTVVLAEPDEEMPGDPSDPGSPAWESTDAATARKWTAIAARLRTALGVMADREMLEAATGDAGDAESAMDLDDAACAVDYAISVLAPFAVDEQAEADCGAADLEMVGKAMAGLDPAHLDTVESLGAIRKAGRTLSASNESALRAAIEALQQILASLPAAPVTKTSGQSVAKTANEESDMATPTLTEDVTEASGQQPAMGTAQAEPKPVAGQAVTEMAKCDGAAPVAKAEKTPQMPVFDAKGNLVGVVDPAEVTRLAMPEGGDAEKSDDAAPEEPAATADAAPAPPVDMTPAPPASVGIPADAVPAEDDTVAKAAASTTEVTQDVLKGSITELVKAAIAEHSAPQGELIKSLEDRNRALEERNTTLAKQAASLEERLTKVENQPAVMAIASNGAVPPAHLLRGQDHGASLVDVTKAEQLRTAFKSSDDARQQKVLAEDLNLLAIEKLREIHSAGPR